MTLHDDSIPKAPLHFELHVTIEDPGIQDEAIKAIDALEQAAQQYALSRQQLKHAMHNGALWLTPNGQKKPHRLRRAKKELKAGDELHFYFDEAIQNTEPSPCELISDEGQYSIWLKPSGVFSQGSKWSDHCTVTRWAEQHLTPERSVFLVHRLDRATTGLILLAHSKKAAQTLSQLFEQREINKHYQAWVHGELQEEPLSIHSEIDNKKAISHFQRVEFNREKNWSLVDVSIETGRKHQIRRHLSEIGHPIVGDRLHGIEKEQPSGENLKLCAYRLGFTCPFSDEEKDIQLTPKHVPWLAG